MERWLELVYTADSKSAAHRACGFESRPRYQIIMRAYLNLEKAQIETLLQLLGEVKKLHRDLSKSEKFVETLLEEALDRALRNW